ncbi:hypothetical protein F383_11566 [Gossypium arboreum]|uniref:Uncharacterized protein n=1 Tax=Gossypium arboreum TaxID=29729 RepID=A0A0B0PZK9_GOSAR|nr:hypothetical protein F383_11566 [Gossypium arboreum]
MIQQKIYDLYRNEKSYNHVCRQSSSRIIAYVRETSHTISKALGIVSSFIFIMACIGTFVLFYCHTILGPNVLTCFSISLILYKAMKNG